jgi:hypothetical protein
VTDSQEYKQCHITHIIALGLLVGAFVQQLNHIVCATIPRSFQKLLVLIECAKMKQRKRQERQGKELLILKTQLRKFNRFALHPVWQQF